MHDLRRQALQSKKTVSRKAQSKQSSRTSSQANSRTTSRANSRNPSRQGSDDEESSLSDGTSWRRVAHVNSIEEVLSGEDSELQMLGWKTDLGETVDQIVDRKRSSGAGREEALAAFNRFAMGKYIHEEIQNRTEEILIALLKSVKADRSEKEAVLALKALALLTISDPSEIIYDLIYQPLKRVIDESESLTVKSSAIHALGAITFYGGVADQETHAIMEYFLEIVESDGHSVDAADSGAVVTAALKEWGFLATQIDDLEEQSQAAMEAFVEQLESSEINVQIAAGENIALVFEKCYTEQEEDESSDEGEEDPEDDIARGAPKMIKRYEPYRNVDQLKHQLSSLASVSSRRLSKKDKKSLHVTFADILNSVENPTRGPRYQNALNQETGKRYGSRMVVRVHRTGVMKIDKWWKLHRLQALRRVLGGGFMIHYEKNAVVFESLPIMITKDK